MDLGLLADLNAERVARRAAIVVTDVTDGGQRLVREAEIGGDAMAEELDAALRSGKSGMSRTEKGEVFLNVHVPPPRVVVIGAVHISQALAPMAKLCGFDVLIVDPRTAFASEERFPDVSLVADWPEDALKTSPLDAYTALVAVTHDPKIDDMPLRAAVDAGCFYIGALGSRKTHAARQARLEATGVASAVLARIEAPVGLDIGAATPPEIAVAVLGSIIRAFRRRGETATA
ncbi:MAG: XdhC family protein [Rhizobiaceae bacterium]|nr:XdhC family protein [Rhizobiaceae bacterium]